MQKIQFNFEVPEEPYVELYDFDDRLVMRTNNENRFLSICCQIKDAKAEGYYVVVPEEMKTVREQNPNAEIIKHKVTPSGRVILNGCRIFQIHSDLLKKLF